MIANQCSVYGSTGAHIPPLPDPAIGAAVVHCEGGRTRGAEQSAALDHQHGVIVCGDGVWPSSDYQDIYPPYSELAAVYYQQDEVFWPTSDSATTATQNQITTC